jgi:uncharacterized protein YdaU (DUF1376 family)
MKTDVWMPLYVADLLADTLHLSRAEFGSYVLLMCAYWRNKGPLRDDDAELASIARASQADWQAHRNRIASLFQVDDGLWRHKRIDSELESAMERKDARKQAGIAGNRARWSQPHRNRIATASQNHRSSQVQSHIYKEEEGATIQPGQTDLALETESESTIRPLPAKFSTQRLSDAWGQWQAHRRGFKKVKSWEALFNAQIDFLEQYDEETAYQILQYSLRNGYQGLFEPKQHANRNTSSQPGANRNSGTSNEGDGSAYAGIGVV